MLLISAQEVGDEREFDYGESSKKGPRHWGELKKEWSACNHGKLQSPVDLLYQRIKLSPKLGEINMNYYKPSNATINNRGHDIAVIIIILLCCCWKIEWLEDAGSIKINGTDYFLKQCHWHSPSEHTLNGRRYQLCFVYDIRFDLELHMVHQSHEINQESKIAVTALFYKIGKPNWFLSKLTRDIINITDTKKEVHQGVIDPKELGLNGSMKYYRYIGSLTVPPCTEEVLWAINTRISTVSIEQVKLLKQAVHDYAEINARPLQPINGRYIYL
ncbi:alpha carbonic anhydrase 7-like [Cannabis sativa]|uniref:alpha carbonic anhydrase 7-like n=1 Tax=Cannabis sativa TaxID=3483 RepID=UPI0029C9E180|nr:alpha carbonic anhydrase 7-like [Cannabis sativa]